MALAVGLLVNVACDMSGGAVGAPCESDSDCDDELICDEHEGKASCQVPHDHGEETDTDDHHDTETTGESTSSDGTTTGDATSGDGTTGDTDTDSSSGGSVEELQVTCTTLCGCLETNCTEFATYPFASSAACMDNCMSFDAPAAGCFNSFCEDVPGSGELAEHYCEHAWGGLGALEC
jgi:hypothetical protein